MMEIINWIFEEKLTLSQKVLLTYVVINTDKTVSIKDFANAAGLSTVELSTSLHLLATKGYLEYKNPLVKLPYKDTLYKVILSLETKPAIIKRKAHTKSDKARRKLENMRLTGFVGQELYIFAYSLEFDKLYVRYFKRTRVSLPPNSKLAKNSKNWWAFKSFYEFILRRGYNFQIYLKACFEAATTGKFKIPLYPVMLCSKWAENKYLNYAKNIMDSGMEEYAIKTETQLIYEVLKSSHILVTQFLKANSGTNRLQAILLAVDSISPLYLVNSKEYLKFINDTEQEYPEEVLKVLERYEKDSDYMNLTRNIFKKVIEEDLDVK